MFARDHAAIGAIIGLSGWPLPVIAGAAVVSHMVVDILDEDNVFEDTIVTAVFELLFIGVIIGLAVYNLDTSSLIAVIVGIIAANVPDIWDSRFYLTYVNRKNWPHLGHWPCHKDYWPSIKLSDVQTMLFSLVTTGAFALMVIQ